LLTLPVLDKSALGPVFEDGVDPDRCVQSNLSPVDWANPHKSLLKSQLKTVKRWNH